jgi:biotin synthase-like enzyme
LEQTAKSVLILDAVDEISPDYSSKLKMLIRAIRDKTASNICISSGFRYRQELEDIVEKNWFYITALDIRKSVPVLGKVLE